MLGEQRGLLLRWNELEAVASDHNHAPVIPGEIR
jgi:hypothetical protein